MTPASHLVRLSSVVVALAGLLGSARADEPPASPTDPFTINVPAGWTDLSPDKPVPPGLPTAIAQDAMARRFAVLAYDLRAKQPGLPDHLRVAVRPNEGPIEKALAKTVEAFSKPSGGPSTATVVEQGVVEVGGIRSGRFVVDLSAGPVKLRQVHYLVPAEKRLAVITFSSSPERFAASLPAFEASAQAIHVRGSANRWLVPTAAGVVGIAFVAAILLVFRQRRRSAA